MFQWKSANCSIPKMSCKSPAYLWGIFLERKIFSKSKRFNKIKYNLNYEEIPFFCSNFHCKISTKTLISKKYAEIFKSKLILSCLCWKILGQSQNFANCIHHFCSSGLQ